MAIEDVLRVDNSVLMKLGVTTENGKNSTLSDLVFVKVIDN